MSLNQRNTVLRVLLVDDHVDTCEVVSRLLEMDGHQAVCAYTVSEARRAIDSGRFDVMICDMDLPDGDGLELLAYARSRFPVQGISLSGHSGDVQERGAAVGFAAHLSKPFSVVLLREAIAQAVSPAPGALDAPIILPATRS